MATYGSIEGIEALSPAIGTIDVASTPTIDQCDEWLEDAYAIVNSAISAAGYVVPVEDAAGAYPVVRALCNLYATAYALRARGLDVVQGEEENRSDIYLKDFYTRLKGLVAMDLTNMGVTLRPSTTTKRRRIRSMQLRRVDGYSAYATGEAAE